MEIDKNLEIKELIEKYKETFKFRIGTDRFVPIAFTEKIAELVFVSFLNDFENLNKTFKEIEEQKKAKNLREKMSLKRNRKLLNKVAMKLNKVKRSYLINKILDAAVMENGRKIKVE